MSKFLLAIQIDILIAVFVNIRSIWVKPFKLLWNSTISLIIVAIYLKFMFDLVINSVKLEIHKRKFGSYNSQTTHTVLNPQFQKYIFIKEDLKEDLKPGIPGIIGQIMMVRDFLICLFTVVFLDSPLL